MHAERVLCRLYEPDGGLLATGTCRFAADPSSPATIRVVLRDPERLLQRYLLDGLRQIAVQFGEGTVLPAQLKRMSFSPRYGSSCALQIGAPAEAAPAAAAVERSANDAVSPAVYSQTPRSG